MLKQTTLDQLAKLIGFEDTVKVIRYEAVHLHKKLKNRHLEQGGGILFTEEVIESLKHVGVTGREWTILVACDLYEVREILQGDGGCTAITLQEALEDAGILPPDPMMTADEFKEIISKLHPSKIQICRKDHYGEFAVVQNLSDNVCEKIAMSTVLQLMEENVIYPHPQKWERIQRYLVTPF